MKNLRAFQGYTIHSYNISCYTYLPKWKPKKKICIFKIYFFVIDFYTWEGMNSAQPDIRQKRLNFQLTTVRHRPVEGSFS